MMEQKLLLIGVVRTTGDRCVLASYAVESSINLAILKELLATTRSSFVDAERKQNTVQGKDFSIHYSADSSGGLVYAIISSRVYAARVAFALLEEFRVCFESHHDASSISNAKEGSLNKSSETLLKALCEKYQDPAKIDKQLLLSSPSRLEVVVQSTNKPESLATLFRNDHKLEHHLSAGTEGLNGQAQVFERKSNRLSLGMRCEGLRWRIAVLALIALALSVVVTPIVMAATRPDYP